MTAASPSLGSLTLSKPQAKRLGLLATLYLSQGLPYGFFVDALPVLMRQRGVPLEGIGLAALLFWPWALKFLWAPIVDHRFSPRLGRRRSWLLPLQGINALLLLLMATWEPNHGLQLLLVVVMAVNLTSATHDIAADGMAVDLLKPSERGLGNSVQVGGYRLGMILGGGVFLILQEQLGWALTFSSMSLLLLVACLPLAFTREAPAPPGTRPDRVRPLALLRDFVSDRRGKTVLALIVAYRLGDGMTSAMLKPFLVDSGLSLADIGWIIGVVGSVVGLAGAMLGGLLIGPLGRERALLFFLVAQASGFAAYALVAMAGWRSWGLFAALSAYEHLVSGMATVGLFTCMMDWCRERHAATDYTLQSSTFVFVMGLGAALGGFSAGQIGYAAHFALGSLACLAAWPVIRWGRDVFVEPRASHPSAASDVVL